LALNFFAGWPLAIPIQFVNGAWWFAKESRDPQQADFIWDFLHDFYPLTCRLEVRSSEVALLPIQDFFHRKPQLLANWQHF
jgi:hypothetical protein